MDLNSLNMFVLVVKNSGFSEASRKSNIPLATISRRVGELEKQMGLRLLERSTRHIRTTREGDILFQFASRGLEEIEAGQLAIFDNHEKLQGVLRLSLPGDANFWWPLLRQFQLHYPRITLDIFTTGYCVDLIADGIDVALRIGDLKSSTAIVRKIAEYRHSIVASPEYIQEYGVPGRPEELTELPCGAWSRNQDETYWNMAGIQYLINSKIKVNDFAHLMDLALQGSIITELPPLLVKPYLGSGQLVKLFVEYPLPTLTLSLLFPSRKYLSPISRAYVDFAVEYCKKEKLFDGL